MKYFVFVLLAFASSLAAQDNWIGILNDTNDRVVEFHVTPTGQPMGPNLLSTAVESWTVYVHPIGFNSGNYDLVARTDNGLIYVWLDRAFTCGNLCTWTPRLTNYPMITTTGPTQPPQQRPDDPLDKSEASGGCALGGGTGILVLLPLLAITRRRKDR